MVEWIIGSPFGSGDLVHQVSTSRYVLGTQEAAYGTGKLSVAVD